MKEQLDFISTHYREIAMTAFPEAPIMRKSLWRPLGEALGTMQQEHETMSARCVQLEKELEAQKKKTAELIEAQNKELETLAEQINNLTPEEE